MDIGTTSLKAALITAEGGVVSFCSVPLEEPHDRFVACSWYSAFLRAREELLCRAENVSAADIAGISISGNGPTIVTETGFTVLWSEDTSDIKIPDLQEAKQSLFLPKILFIKEKFPDVFKKTKKFFSGPEYLIYVLTGNAITILPEKRFEAAYWTDGLLPPFCSIGDKCGIVSDNISELPSGCPVFAGGPDFVAALIGTGTLQSGRLCDRCGSSEGLNFCTDHPVTGEGLRTLPSVIPGLWNVSYLIPNSGELSETERLSAVKQGISCLKKAAENSNIKFPKEMSVTGGQTSDELLLKEKAEALGISILRPADNHFVHSELLGDACAGWTGLGVYKSLQAAAEKIVRLRKYENL